MKRAGPALVLEKRPTKQALQCLGPAPRWVAVVGASQSSIRFSSKKASRQPKRSSSTEGKHTRASVTARSAGMGFCTGVLSSRYKIILSARSRRQRCISMATSTFPNGKQVLKPAGQKYSHYFGSYALF